ncbi:AraC family transcriptional regulator [Rhizobium sp. RU36D]|uniref:AraC family transcriptional regulator n=1 Tax=Rhizobium sp. RU36D TaxID=1907415 RepID=UPI0009D867D0|nr:AraC family transcriptional regulator [Rhizobium sp. RU36D]SMD09234.1 transcriptional regulator, AraC family [Rhizobium sp. RU36D]
MRVVAAPEGIEQIEAAFRGEAFAPHRHDTYAIGITLQGVQTFRYRGAQRFSLPGNVIVLHPDELHDGAAGTETGLLYRMIYVPPALIAAAGAQDALPFVADPVVADKGFRDDLGSWLAEFDAGGGELAADGLVAMLGDRLAMHSRTRGTATGQVSKAVRICRDYLADNCMREVGSEELERVAGLDRYTLARQFRLAYATSPHRYQVMRRLDLARRLMRQGERLAEAALAAGFADQSHFTRHFKRTYGMPPGRWLTLTSAR